MSSADQLLAQQANQTMALFQAIDRNTQQAFANRSAVQQMELQAGMKVTQLLEEQRMNDLRASAVRQSMSIQAQKFAAEKKLLPMKEKVAELQMRNALRAEQVKAADPVLGETKAFMREMIQQNPTLAGDATRAFNEKFDQLMSNPDTDITSDAPQLRSEMEKWFNDQRMIREVGPPAANPTKPKVDKIGAQTAAQAIDYFGGDSRDFLYEHDDEYRQRTDNALRFAKLTGKFDEKMLSALPAMKQQEVFDTLEKGAKIKDLDSAYKNLLEEYKTYDDIAKSVSGPVGEQARTQLDSIVSNLQRIRDEKLRLSGVQLDQGGGSGGSPPPEVSPSVEAARAAMLRNSGDLPTSQEQVFVDSMDEVERKVSAASPVVEQLISGDKKQWESLKQTMQQNPSLLYDPARAPQIFKELVNPTERQVLEAVKNPEFGKMLLAGESGMNPVMTPMGTVMRPVEPSPAAKAYYTLTNKSSSRDEQKRAINVLKPMLPELVLRYIQAR